MLLLFLKLCWDLVCCKLFVLFLFFGKFWKFEFILKFVIWFGLIVLLFEVFFVRVFDCKWLFLVCWVKFMKLLVGFYIKLCVWLCVFVVLGCMVGLVGLVISLDLIYIGILWDEICFVLLMIFWDLLLNVWFEGDVFVFWDVMW